MHLAAVTPREGAVASRDKEHSGDARFGTRVQAPDPAGVACSQVVHSERLKRDSADARKWRKQERGRRVRTPKAVTWATAKTDRGTRKLARRPVPRVSWLIQGTRG